MRQLTIDLYKFNELPESLQQGVINYNIDINVLDTDWWEHIYNDAKDIGLLITAFDLDRKEIHARLTIDIQECINKILENHGTKTWAYIEAKKYLENTKDIQVNSPLHQIRNNDFIYNLRQGYLSILQDEYDYLISDEAVAETLIANEYEFLSNGTIFRGLK